MFKKLKAFTMAEAILVMTILGIIATIMISTLKPAEYKDKALKIMAKKVMSEIDVATTQILMNHSVDGTFTNLKTVDGSEIINLMYYEEAQKQMANLYKKYLTVIRRKPIVKYNALEEPSLHEENQEDSILSVGRDGGSFVLKDGASMGIFPASAGNSREAKTIFPGETERTDSYIATDGYYIVFDTNDGEGPNVWGKDRFAFFIDAKGIAYEAKEGRPSQVCAPCMVECQGNPSSCGCSNDWNCFLEYCSDQVGFDCSLYS